MATQEDFADELGDAIMTLIENCAQNESARSDWIIYVLMELAGGILSHAPHDVRGLVLMQALQYFGNASGARVDHFDMGQASQTVN